MKTSIFILTWLVLVVPCQARVIYVDVNTPDNNDGSSWGKAYKYLQDALGDAESSGDVNEIRVAQGVYTPDSNTAIPDGSGDREATFQLVNGVALRGGYAGFGEAEPNARDIGTFETVLSGDLDSNDVDVNDPCDLLTEPTRNENSNNVIRAWHVNASAVIDGFTVTAGNGNGSYPSDRGGGLHTNNSSPIVTGCLFKRNSAGAGGAIYNGRSTLTITNCTFSENASNGHGGAIGNHTSTLPSVANCTFVRNWSGNCGAAMSNEHGSNSAVADCVFIENSVNGSGGGMYNYISNPILTNCVFSQNSANEGAGALHNGGSSPILLGCVFTDNWTVGWGGAVGSALGGNPIFERCTITSNLASHGGSMYNYQSDATLSNCNLIDNVASVCGGAIYNYAKDVDCNLTLTNCTFAGNSAPDGNALACNSYGYAIPSTVYVNNCILWNGGNEIWNNDGSAFYITHCDLQGGWLGEGNIDIDPLFADPNNNDYHLQSQAGRYDPTTETWVQDANTSPCIDAGDPNSPIGLEPFPNGGIINMGAYGGTTEASKSYFGTTPCETIVAGDINGDCIVNFKDMAIMGLHWLKDNRE